jgi:hypothetical protein
MTCNVFCCSRCEKCNMLYICLDMCYLVGSALVFVAIRAGSQILFRVRRPFYFVNSHMNIEEPTGQVIGEVHQRWHPLRRNYDLFLGKRQVAFISGQFLAWQFVLQDENGGMPALRLWSRFQDFFLSFGYPLHAGSPESTGRADTKEAWKTE